MYLLTTNWPSESRHCIHWRDWSWALLCPNSRANTRA
jgi:hypothetical protein